MKEPTIIVIGHCESETTAAILSALTSHKGSIVFAQEAEQIADIREVIEFTIKDYSSCISEIIEQAEIDYTVNNKIGATCKENKKSEFKPPDTHSQHLLTTKSSSN